MKLTVTSQKLEIIPLRDMRHTQFAVAVNGQFKGEVFYCNVAGIHGLTEDRYWPSAYIAGKTDGYVYTPDFDVQLLQEGDILTIK